MSKPLTNKEIEAMAFSAAAATPGPWRWNKRANIESATAVTGEGEYAEPVVIIETDSHYYPPSDIDAAFIISAREDVPRLVAEVRRLRADVERVGDNWDEADLRAVTAEMELARLRSDEWLGTAAKEIAPLLRADVVAPERAEEILIAFLRKHRDGL